MNVARPSYLDPLEKATCSVVLEGSGREPNPGRPINSALPVIVPEPEHGCPSDTTNYRQEDLPYEERIFFEFITSILQSCSSLGLLQFFHNFPRFLFSWLKVIVKALAKFFGSSEKPIPNAHILHRKYAIINAIKSPTKYCHAWIFLVFPSCLEFHSLNRALAFRSISLLTTLLPRRYSP